jgi:hypothetical protein
MRTRFYNWLLRDIIPYVRFTTYYADFPGYKYHEGYFLLKPGDIILTVDDKKLTTKLISKATGEEGFSHAAFCVSKNQIFEVAEMTHKDFTKSCFFDICKEATRVVILRCSDFDNAYINEMIKLTSQFANCKYDTQFKLGIEALSCSELVYYYDFQHRLKVDLTPILGNDPYISPMGLFQAKNVRIVWDSSKPMLRLI